MPDTDPVCHLCAAPRERDLLAWVLDRDDGETRWLCPACARTHLRDIEARLAREWWG